MCVKLSIHCEIPGKSHTHFFLEMGLTDAQQSAACTYGFKDSLIRLRLPRIILLRMSLLHNTHSQFAYSSTIEFTWPGITRFQLQEANLSRR